MLGNMLFSILALLAAITTLQSQADNSDPRHNLHVNMNIDAEFFKQADSNKDGVLDIFEFEAAMDKRLDAAIAENPYAQKHIGSKEREGIRDLMVKMFRSVDANSDGKLTLGEVLAYGRAAKPSANQ